MSSNDARFRNRQAGISNSAVVKYAGGAATPKASFVRPADTTPYAVGDIVANAGGAVVPMQFTAAREFATSFLVSKARIRKSNASLTNAAFKLHLYGALPVASNPDNGAFLTDKSADYIGWIPVVMDRAFTDGAQGTGARTDGAITVELATGRVVYGLLEATAAYTPVSGEAFEVTLEVLQD